MLINSLVWETEGRLIQSIEIANTGRRRTFISLIISSMKFTVVYLSGMSGKKLNARV
jgi:hypothetical protein